MAKRSTLTNMLSEPFDQVVNGKHIVIKPGETQTFARSEAVDIKGFYCGLTKVGLKIVHLPDGDEVKKETPKIYCAPDGKEFTDKNALLEYMKKKG
jgi:hypothetical protein